LEKMWNRYSMRRRSRRSRQEYRFERVITLVLTVGSPSNFHRSFRTLFSFEYIWNLYSVRRRSRRSRPVYRFERAITFDRTVGSPLNFYKSFRTLFSLE
jgi:hypothetical protein